jgi:hypothetical protein
MIANIELKSLDFDDENFSPVFNRATQEVFLHPSEKFKADFHKVNLDPELNPTIRHMLPSRVLATIKLLINTCSTHQTILTTENGLSLNSSVDSVSVTSS